MGNHIWLNLQLFSEGGAATGGDASGGTAQAAAVQEPQAEQPRKLSREERRQAALERQNAFLAGQDAQPQDRPATGTPEGTPPPATFAERMKADPAFKQEASQYIEGIVKERLKNSKQAESTLSTLQPALERLAQRYGADAGDPAALAESILNDDAQYEQEALEQGLPIETVKELDRLKREGEELKAQREEAAMMAAMQGRAMELRGQEADLQQLFPNFTMESEMNNPLFVNLAFSPNLVQHGMTLKNAFYALYGEELVAKGAQMGKQQGALSVTQSIRSNARRPSENGMSGAAPSQQSTAPNLRNMTEDAKRAYLRSVRERIKREGDIYTL